MSEVTVMPGNTTAVLEDQASYPLVSNELRQILESVFYVALNGILGVLGSIANVINLIVFIKQVRNNHLVIKFMSCSNLVKEYYFSRWTKLRCFVLN